MDLCPPSIGTLSAIDRIHCPPSPESAVTRSEGAIGPALEAASKLELGGPGVQRGHLVSHADVRSVRRRIHDKLRLPTVSHLLIPTWQQSQIDSFINKNARADRDRIAAHDDEKIKARLRRMGRGDLCATTDYVILKDAFKHALGAGQVAIIRRRLESPSDPAEGDCL